MRISDWSSDVCSSDLVGAQVQNLGAFVWSIAEILRGDFKQSEYGKVILPFVVLRRLDCILEATKDAVLAEEKTLPDGVDEATQDMILFGAAGSNLRVYNRSRFTFESLKGQDPAQRSEEHTSELQSLMRISYAVFCLKKKNK